MSVNLGLKLKVPAVPKELPPMEIEFKPPTARIPGYVPMVIPPNNLETPEGVEAESTEEPVAPQVQIPVLDIKMPLPTAEVVATATYAAVAAVATTTLATPFFDQIKKKLQKFIQGKVDKWKEKRKQRKDSSES
ncbi:hypothetical protein PRUG_00021 [Prochlorococcus phage P-SSP6]|uniref:Uncharacterized protein n=2 Tax=Tangaroavirus tv951510a TaxID=2733962 RepID=M1Q6U1_9CAUD|nr:hypothetical protein CYOG_00027 [Cyanophage 9515-10a]ADP00048.1 predicted protein [Cyanophage 9515-10a]AGF91578.1 hypothetical protein PRUG_00021 [Prochlorococcus phage P-SSP6]